MARPKKKPEYDSDQMVQQLMEAVTDAYLNPPQGTGHVPVTYADTSALERDFGFKPHTPLREGLRKFAEWYKEFYMKED